AAICTASRPSTLPWASTTNQPCSTSPVLAVYVFMRRIAKSRGFYTKIPLLRSNIRLSRSGDGLHGTLDGRWHELRRRNGKQSPGDDGRRAGWRRPQPRSTADGNRARRHRRLHRLRRRRDPDEKRPGRARLRGQGDVRARADRPEGFHQDPHALHRAWPQFETQPGRARDPAVTRKVLLRFHHARQDRRHHHGLRDNRRLAKTATLRVLLGRGYQWCTKKLPF